MSEIMEQTRDFLKAGDMDNANRFLQSIEDHHEAVAVARRFNIVPFLNWVRDRVNSGSIPPAEIVDYIPAFDRFLPDNKDGLIGINRHIFSAGLQENDYVLCLRAIFNIALIDEDALDLAMRIMSLKYNDYSKQLSRYIIHNGILKNNEEKIIELIKANKPFDKGIEIVLLLMQNYEITFMNLESIFYPLMELAFKKCKNAHYPLILLQVARENAEKSTSNWIINKYNDFVNNNHERIEKYVSLLSEGND